MNIEKNALEKHKSSVDSARDKENNNENKNQETNTENESEKGFGKDTLSSVIFTN